MHLNTSIKYICKLMVNSPITGRSSRHLLAGASCRPWSDSLLLVAFPLSLVLRCLSLLQLDAYSYLRENCASDEGLAMMISSWCFVKSSFSAFDYELSYHSLLLTKMLSSSLDAKVTCFFSCSLHSWPLATCRPRSYTSPEGAGEFSPKYPFSYCSQ